jgi:uncharacterized membrane protein YsdA (DUF1294 family)/endonuclease YncB( thermonuclease family)
MPAGLVLLAAAASSFVCRSPRHHDGDNVRCANIAEAIRLQGIDAPEMPGACRPGRDCTPGDPYAARDHLRSLSAGRDLSCTAEAMDDYGRIIARCAADGVDLSCAMIASGHAVPRYAPIDCDGTPAAEAAPPAAALPATPDTAPPATPSTPPPTAQADDVPTFAPANMPARPAKGSTRMVWPLVLLWLLVINLACWFSFATDKARAERFKRRFHPEPRIPEAALLGLAALGGSPAAWAAMHHFRHKISKPAFRLRLLLISGVQLGALIGGLWLLVSG